MLLKRDRRRRKKLGTLKTEVRRDDAKAVTEHFYVTCTATTSAYWKSDTMFDLKYCNWNKDMLMGVLPNSQFGDVAVIDISNTEGPISSSIFLKSPNSAASSQVTTTGSYNALLLRYLSQLRRLLLLILFLLVLHFKLIFQICRANLLFLLFVTIGLAALERNQSVW